MATRGTGGTAVARTDEVTRAAVNRRRTAPAPAGHHRDGRTFRDHRQRSNGIGSRTGRYFGRGPAARLAHRAPGFVVGGWIGPVRADGSSRCDDDAAGHRALQRIEQLRAGKRFLQKRIRAKQPGGLQQLTALEVIAVA